MFSMKKYFSAENVFIFQIFLRVTLFFISIMFLFVCLFVFWGARKEEGGRWEGEGAPQKRIKAYKELGGSNID